MLENEYFTNLLTQLLVERWLLMLKIQLRWGKGKAAFARIRIVGRELCILDITPVPVTLAEFFSGCGLIDQSGLLLDPIWSVSPYFWYAEFQGIIGIRNALFSSGSTYWRLLAVA